VTLARIANFAILAGILYWLGRKPIAEHLATRGAQIRKDLVDAAETRTTATARLAEIESRLAALPGELERMRTRSAEELEAERTRIRATAETERDRLVEQARREIASQTRNARAELRAHAATLAVDVAEARLRSTLTPAEQSTLVDQYVGQIRNVQ
jgi:F-type H+-transporting ATPase subunit b